MRQRNILLVLLSLSLSLSVQQGYEKGVLVSSTGDSLPYRVIRPESMKAGRKYPLVLFLHGVGERENDNERQLTCGGQIFLNPVNREKYPASVFAPQCPAGSYWVYMERLKLLFSADMSVGQKMSPFTRILKQLLDTYLAMPEVDKKRIYITGLLMGAMGTYDLVVRYSEIFAAVAPICGSANLDRLPAAKEVKFRISHGDADDAVAVEGLREAYKTLKAAGARVEHIEFPGCNHDSWNPIFNYPGLMEWLFEQRK